MALRQTLFLIVALTLMAGLHRYVWARLVRDTGMPARGRKVGRGVLVGLYVALFASFVAMRSFPRDLAGPIVWVGFSWLGLLFFLVVWLLLADLARAIALRTTHEAAPASPSRRQAFARIFGGAAAALGVGTSAVAAANVAGATPVARVRVVLDKLARRRSGYRIVQISDVHVGPTLGRAFVERVVATINQLAPDLVAITGDLVDGKVAELAEHVAPLADLRARDGVFFVTGNHEYYSGADSWIQHLGTLGVRVLRNERVAIGGEDGFDLAGIDDASSRGLLPGHGPDLERALAARDPARPVVLLAHQPRGVHRADELGVDLQLSGHTHGGQLFPWNFLVKLQQPFVAGLHRLATAQIYVSRGTGYWGPPMRLAAPSEITEIELVGAG